MRSRFMFIAAVLTVAVLVGWAVNTISSESYTLQRNAGDVQLVECEPGSRASVSRVPPSIGRVACGPLPSTLTPTDTPTSALSASSTPLPFTPTPTVVVPTPTFTWTPIPSTPTPSTATDACTNNPDCGTPRNFCDTWTGGACNDYRAVGATVFESPFDAAGNNVSIDCLDTGTPSYLPSMLGGSLPFPCFFQKLEHWMGRMESGGFGVALMRFHRPIDLASERHIHVETDLKPSNVRNYVRVMLSPDLTKRDVDDRGGQAYPRSFIQAWFRNGDVEGSICRNGVCEGDSYPWGDAFHSTWPPSATADNVRVDIDIYVSQTSIRVYINGTLRVSDTFAALGFDKAYLYLSQASYNPCKDGRCSAADQIAHWDSIAWDGPTLGPNSLTPDGWRDISFNAYGASSCTVNTVPAVAQTNGTVQGYTWTTWVARIVDDNMALAIQCVPGPGWSLASQPIRAIEVVRP